MNQVPTVNPQQQFEEAIKNRIRADIGDLIPDEVLAGLVEKAIQSMFFTKKVEKKQYGNDIHYPSWFEDEIERCIRGQIQKTVEAYFEKHGDKISQAVSEELVTAVPKLAADFLVSSITNKLAMVSYSLDNRIANKLSR